MCRTALAGAALVLCVCGCSSNATPQASSPEAAAGTSPTLVTHVADEATEASAADAVGIPPDAGVHSLCFAPGSNDVIFTVREPRYAPMDRVYRALVGDSGQPTGEIAVFADAADFVGPDTRVFIDDLQCPDAADMVLMTVDVIDTDDRLIWLVDAGGQLVSEARYKSFYSEPEIGDEPVMVSPSPDGSLLMMLQLDGRVELVDARSWEMVDLGISLFAVYGGPGGSIVWSPDSRYVALSEESGVGDGRLWVVDVSGEEPDTVYESDTSSVVDPWFEEGRDAVSYIEYRRDVSGEAHVVEKLLGDGAESVTGSSFSGWTFDALCEPMPPDGETCAENAGVRSALSVPLADGSESVLLVQTNAVWQAFADSDGVRVVRLAPRGSGPKPHGPVPSIARRAVVYEAYQPPEEDFDVTKAIHVVHLRRRLDR